MVRQQDQLTGEEVHKEVRKTCVCTWCACVWFCVLVVCARAHTRHLLYPVHGIINKTGKEPVFLTQVMNAFLRLELLV